MALSKIQAESMNLADTYAFTGTVSGAGGMDLILSATISSPVSSYDISSTYINSTYDNYKLIAKLIPDTDTVTMRARFFVNGTVDEGVNYGSEIGTFDGGAVLTSDSQDQMNLVRYNIGSESGEGVSIIGTLTNINSTNLPASFMGTSHGATTDGNLISSIFFNGHKTARAGDVINGLRIQFSSGNIESGNVQLYGLRS